MDNRWNDVLVKDSGTDMDAADFSFGKVFNNRKEKRNAINENSNSYDGPWEEFVERNAIFLYRNHLEE